MAKITFLINKIYVFLKLVGVKCLYPIYQAKKYVIYQMFLRNMYNMLLSVVENHVKKTKNEWDDKMLKKYKESYAAIILKKINDLDKPNHRIVKDFKKKYGKKPVDLNLDFNRGRLSMKTGNFKASINKEGKPSFSYTIFKV
jgi:hypothetical protein